MTTALTIVQELKSNDMMAKISASLGKPISDPSVLKFITGACMTIQEKPELSRCSRQSIIDSVVNAASVQLPVDNQHLAYLLPRGGVCCFQPSYMGYISKIKESDPTADFTICPVYKGDTFSFIRENGQASYKHIPMNPFEDNPKNMVGMYVYVKTATSSHIEILSYAELMKIKGASPNASGVIWNKWEIEMLKAKAVRRSCKTKFPAAVAKLNALADIADGIGLKAPAPVLAATAPLPEIPEAEVSKEEPKQVEQSEPTPEEIAAKAAEAKARLHAEDEKPAGEATKAPADNDSGLAPEPKEIRLKGLIAAYYPPKGKGPASVYIQGEYAKTFDVELAKTLKAHKDLEEEIELVCIVEVNGQYSNNMIKELIAVH